jgi:hypothetical protein
VADELKQVELKLEEATGYIRQVLEDSRRSLAELLKRVDLSRGRVVTWGPAGRPLPADFSHGGLFAEVPPGSWQRRGGSVAKPVPSTTGPLVQEIVSFLAGDPLRLCLLANENLDAGDAAARSAPARAVYGNELYHFIPAGTSPPEIERTLKIARSLPTFVGVLAAPTAKLGLRVEAMAESVLQAVVASTTGILVGAYDGEGFLLWRRADV